MDVQPLLHETAGHKSAFTERQENRMGREAHAHKHKPKRDDELVRCLKYIDLEEKFVERIMEHGVKKWDDLVDPIMTKEDLRELGKLAGMNFMEQIRFAEHVDTLTFHPRRMAQKVEEGSYSKPRGCNCSYIWALIRRSIFGTQILNLAVIENIDNPVDVYDNLLDKYQTLLLTVTLFMLAAPVVEPFDKDLEPEPGDHMWSRENVSDLINAVATVCWFSSITVDLVVMLFMATINKWQTKAFVKEFYVILSIPENCMFFGLIVYMGGLAYKATYLWPDNEYIKYPIIIMIILYLVMFLYAWLSFVVLLDRKFGLWAQAAGIGKSIFFAREDLKAETQWKPPSSRAKVSKWDVARRRVRALHLLGGTGYTRQNLYEPAGADTQTKLPPRKSLLRPSVQAGQRGSVLSPSQDTKDTSSESTHSDEPNASTPLLSARH